jgi:beta-galactosidase
MAEHYAENPNVIGWQIDNEFGNRCYCEICRGKFHEWLQERYGGLQKLNGEWGTEFWSHIYTEWSQIPTPVSTARSHNPGLHLDYKRFMSDSFRAYQKYQIDIIRKYTSDQFITHNLMGFGYNQLNYFDNAEDIDFVSWDIYKRMQWDMKAAIDPSNSALSADTMRGLKKKNFWVMEQQSGGGGWEIVAVPPKPGELRLWTYQSIAHGADAILYFRWRTCRTGTEQYWHGVLDHHGIPGRRYDEVCQVGKELQKIGEIIAGSEVKPKAAIIQSYDTRFAFQVQPNNPRFSYEGHIHDIYRAFFNRNIPVDIISEKDSFVGYKLVVVPSVYVLSEETAANLESFASAGGVVVFTPRTGVKDDANKVVDMKLPGLVARMAGVEIEEYISMPEDEDSKIQFDLPNLEEEFPAAVWADILNPTTARAVAYYTEDYYARQPAVTINEFNVGKVIYLGTMGDASFYDAVIGWVAEIAEVPSLIETPKGVEVTERWSDDQRILIILNHTQKEQQIQLNGKFRDVLADKPVSDKIVIPPLDVVILEG